MASNRTVEAAGGLVTRMNPAGEPEILLVHRTVYDDWSLPKGKKGKDESLQECALREVEEETALRCELGQETSGTFYRDRKDRYKVVRYWTMSPLSGTACASNEIDAIEWVPLRSAGDRLTWPRDREIVEHYAAAESDPSPALLLRHASAVGRRRWNEDDLLRPLDSRGRAEAQELVPTLAAYAVARIFTSPFRRCIETVEPMAIHSGLPIEIRPELAEGTGAEPAMRLVRGSTPAAVVCCTHGDVIQAVVGPRQPAEKASIREIVRHDLRAYPGDYIQPPNVAHRPTKTVHSQ